MGRMLGAYFVQDALSSKTSTILLFAVGSTSTETSYKHPY